MEQLHKRSVFKPRDPTELTAQQRTRALESFIFITAISSTYGLNYLTRIFPDITIWTGAVDEELTAKSYIVPGLGDAGDLCYGSKGGEIHSPH